MLVFAHLAVGDLAGLAWKKGNAPQKPKGKPLSFYLPVAWIGALLPDVIDKPLYYLYASELISGTRTFGHTLLLTGLIAMVASIFREQRWQRLAGFFSALAVGTASHLFLDLTSSWIAPFFTDVWRSGPSTEAAIFFPFFGADFPDYPFQGFKDHAAQSFGGPLIWFEFAALLYVAVRLWFIFGDNPPRGKKSKAVRSKRA